MKHEEVRTVLVGGLSRQKLLNQLHAAGVALNNHAEMLLAEAAPETGSDRQAVSVVERSAGELGLADGGTLAEIFDRARAAGLGLCPPVTGAYLRLTMRDRASAPDSVLSVGRAPSGSLTVAAPRLRADDGFPRGLYLRVIDGRAWLRGYRCDDEHLWSVDDRFVFRVGETATPTP